MKCTKESPRCERSCLLPPCCYRALKQTLIYATNLLEKHDIAYWLDYGSLLGAIRSQSIIPWDTDCDVSILAKDLDKLMSLEKIINKNGFWFEDYHKVIKCIYWSKTNFNGLDIYVHDIVPASEHKLYWERPNGKTTNFDTFGLPPLLEKKIKSKVPIITHYAYGSQIDHTTDMPYWFVENLEKTKMLGKWMSCPRSPEKFLSFRYGKRWKSPMHHDSERYICKGCNGNREPLTKALAYVSEQ